MTCFLTLTLTLTLTLYQQGMNNASDTAVMGDGDGMRREIFLHSGYCTVRSNPTCPFRGDMEMSMSIFLFSDIQSRMVLTQYLPSLTMLSPCCNVAAPRMYFYLVIFRSDKTDLLGCDPLSRNVDVGQCRCGVPEPNQTLTEHQHLREQAE